MNWSAVLRAVRGIPMYSQRLGNATLFPQGTLEVDNALASEPTAVLVGYPYYQGRSKTYYLPRSTWAVRRKLYRLALPSIALKLVDIGDIQSRGQEASMLLEEVVREILRRGHRVLVVGGSQEAAHALYRAIAAQEIAFTYTLIDRKLDLLDAISAVEMPHRRFHRDMLMDGEVLVPVWGQVLGLAWHWVSGVEEEILHAQLRVPYLRLSEILADPDLAEPFLRTADLITMDLGIVRGADAPAVLDPEPEGLPIEIAAKLMRFAGMGYRSFVLHIANYFPNRDTDGRTAAALAVLYWYFLEGLINPQNDFPSPDRSNLDRYEVLMPESEPTSLTFYQHTLTGRWWMEIVPEGGMGRLFPCTRREYEEALRGEVPRLWYVLMMSLPTSP
ncbi:MAG: hypothetical protein NZ580_05720 [Bacteroidia bacterium]|nr:hypothetical protein [Bacteroidia bacterium]MDW8236314.1 hypothetical protein [Bacteroidia bacterium]